MNRVAVYGSLKKGFGNHSLLLGSQYLGTTDTYPEWNMYSLGGFPAITYDGDTPICVEVYKVDDETMNDLDMLEGYPNFYNRRVIDTKYGKAWIYYIQDAHSVNQYERLEHGVW